MADRTHFAATGLTGGGADDLDFIGYATPADGDPAVVIVGSLIYFYEYDSSSSAAELSPDVIKPDDAGANPGRWLLVKVHTHLADDTTPELGGELDAGAHSIGFTEQSAIGDGTTTIDWKLGNKFFFTFGNANETFTFTAPSNPCSLTLVMKQYSTGGKTATWPASVKWADGIVPTLSTGNDAIDIISLYYDGTNYYGVMSKNFS